MRLAVPATGGCFGLAFQPETSHKLPVSDPLHPQTDAWAMTPVSIGGWSGYAQSEVLKPVDILRRLFA
jgi:hypothetical protein